MHYEKVSSLGRRLSVIVLSVSHHSCFSRAAFLLPPTGRVRWPQNGLQAQQRSRLALLHPWCRAGGDQAQQQWATFTAPWWVRPLGPWAPRVHARHARAAQQPMNEPCAHPSSWFASQCRSGYAGSTRSRWPSGGILLLTAPLPHRAPARCGEVEEPCSSRRVDGRHGHSRCG